MYKDDAIISEIQFEKRIINIAFLPSYENS